MRLFTKTAGMLAAGASLVLLAATGPATAESPFASLVGTWSGKGTAKLDSGKRERLSCKGYYTGSGSSTLRLNILCANASTKVELRSKLQYANGRVTGSWEERNYNQQGTITGTATETNLRLSIGGGALQGRLNVEIDGTKQSVQLSTSGSVLRGVSITFARIG